MFNTRSELEQLVAVAETGRIVAAAERREMTQPALTRAIAKLERRAHDGGVGRANRRWGSAPPSDCLRFERSSPGSPRLHCGARPLETRGAIRWDRAPLQASWVF